MSLWEYEKTVTDGRYVFAVVSEHPNSNENGYIPEHRIIIENKLGRVLDTNEIVHHKNGDKKDNSEENLELKSRLDHSKEHAKEQIAEKVILRCPASDCDDLFIRRKGMTHLVEGRGNSTACSRSCSGKFSHSDKSGFDVNNIVGIVKAKSEYFDHLASVV